MHAQVQTYAQHAASTASPAQLTLMCYDGVLSAIVRSEQALGAADLETANRELLRAQTILGELQLTLDHERGGDIARNLDALYTFCIDQLLSANLIKDSAPLPGVHRVMSGLRDAWEQACCRVAVVA